VVGYGLALFLTLGGARNYLIAALVPVLIVAYMLGLIKIRHLIFVVFYH